jgi:hypothetical protein
MSELAPSRRPEVKDKISIANTGRVISDETKQKLSTASLKQFSNIDNRKLLSKKLNTFYENNPEARIKAREIAKQKYEEYKQTDEYTQWLKSKPEYDLYRMEVTKLTFENDLSKLKNWSKRNLFYKYEIDHIYPIKKAFNHGIPAELIGDIKNLRIIPRTENRSKSGKVTIIPEHIQKFLENRL